MLLLHKCDAFLRYLASVIEQLMRSQLLILWVKFAPTGFPSYILAS